MIYPHQQQAIDWIVRKLQEDPQIEALLISGSIAHGFNSETSDVDINLVVSGERYREKQREGTLLYWESAEAFYPGGYFDGKLITLDTLDLMARRGNEPTRFALHDAIVAFDKTGRVPDLLRQIGTFPDGRAQENALRFISQLDAWNWYCGEALRRGNAYLLDMSVSKLILFAGRLILLDNRVLFPYHKWFLRVLEQASNKPPMMMDAIQRLLANKTPETVGCLYEMVKAHRDWTAGQEYRWPDYFLHDVETVWMRGEDFIENL